MEVIAKKKPFYGWVIVLASILISAAGIGLVNTTNSVLLKPVCEELGFSRAEFTMHKTIIILVGAFLLPVYGKIIRKTGVKRVLLVSAVFLPLITFTYSFATELWHFYLIAVLNGVFFNGINFMTIGILISNWFEDKRGFATGLAYSGSGLGAAVLLPLVGYIAENHSWQWVYRFIGIVVIAVLIPIILLLVKEKPESMGLTAYKSKKDETETATLRQETGITLREATRTPRFWLVMVAFFLLSFMASGPNAHTIPYLTDIGYSTAFATSVMSFIMIMLTAGKIGIGFLYDKMGTLLGGVFISLCCVVFPVCAVFALAPGGVWIYAVFYGIASAGFSVPVTVMIEKYFGSRDFATIFSFCTMVTTLSAAIAAPIMGAVYDTIGSYIPAWIMLAIFGGIITVCMVAADISNRKAKGKAMQ